MKSKLSVVYCERLANFFEVAGVMLALVLAFLMQFVYNKLPCPLCLLQRFGLMAIAFGFLLNFRFGFRPSHYSIILISSLFTASVALRQVALHILPGSGSYGSAIFGMHLYTWSFIVAMLVIISTSLLLGVERQYLEKVRKTALSQHVVTGLFACLVFLAVANIVSAFFECGFSACPDNPVVYSLIS